MTLMTLRTLVLLCFVIIRDVSPTWVYIYMSMYVSMYVYMCLCDAVIGREAIPRHRLTYAAVMEVQTDADPQTHPKISLHKYTPTHKPVSHMSLSRCSIPYIHVLTLIPLTH